MSSRITCLALLAILLFSILSPLLTVADTASSISKIHPLLYRKLVSMEGSEPIEVVIRLSPLPREIQLQVKGNYELAVNALMKWAEYTQLPIVRWIQSNGGTVLNRFWLDNVILAKLPAKLVVKLAENPSVVRIFENFEVRIAGPVIREPVDARTNQVSSWGIFKIRANEAWSLGITGEGVRIAVLDTGVDVTHPALAGKMLTVTPGDPYYPGGWMEFDGNGNPVRSTPHDTHGHGTHVSGTALGGDTSDILIGVAPGATLMHGLVLPGGGGTFAQVLAGMEWTVNPYYLTPDGQKVYTGLPAHVVSMSWGANEYYSNELLPAVEAMLLANIIPVAAIGNGGAGTTSNPGNIWGVFGIGATDIYDNVASFSSGKVVTWPSPPATWPFFDTYPSTYIKPDLSAPGVSITSSVPGGGYEAWSGTSMATPHVSGTVALILQAAGWLNYDVPDIPEKVYLILNSTAVDFGTPGQDIRYGWGRIDAYEAVRKALEYAKKSGVEGYVYDSVSGEPIKWASVTVLETGMTYKVNASGYYKIPLNPGNYTLVFSAWGYENITSQVEVVLLNGTITGVVSDAISGAPIAGANVTVVELNLTAVTDENGVYEVSVPPGTYTLTTVATGYQPATETVSVDEGKVVVVNFYLYPLGNETIETLTGVIKPHLYTRVDVYMNRLPHGFVTGRVLGSNGAVLAGASVKVIDTPVTVSTNATGQFYTWLPAGTYVLEVSYPGYGTKYINVEVTVNETVDLGDIVLKGLPRAAIMWDHAGSIKSFLESKGWYAQDYSNLAQLTSDILAGMYDVVIYSGDYDVPFPSSDEFYAFLNAIHQMGVGVIWMDSWGSYGYGIKVLNRYLGDPSSVGYSFGYPVYIVVTKIHPILKGYKVGDVVPIVTYSYADYSWFTGFSGEAIADTYAGGVVRGNSIAWKVFDDGVKWVLLSSFAPTSWNTPDYFTSDAWNILYNALTWVTSRPLNLTLENPYLHVGDTGVLHITRGPANTILYIYMDGELFTTIDTDENGSATLVFTTPLIPGGSHLIEVSTEDMLYYGYTELYVVANIVVSPTVIPAPGTVYIEATGLKPSQQVFIYLDGNYLSLYLANSSGAFSIRLNIPFVETGYHDIVILDTDGSVIASETIYVGSRLDDVLSRLDQLLEKSDQLGVKIDAVLGDTAVIKTDLGTIQVKLDTLLEKLGLLNATITSIKDDTVFIKTKIGDLQVKLEDLMSALSNVNATLKELIVSSSGEIYGLITTVYGNLTAKSDALVQLVNSKLPVDTNTLMTTLRSDIGSLNTVVQSKINDLLSNLGLIPSTLANMTTKLDAILSKLNEVASKTDISDLKTSMNTGMSDLSSKLDEKAKKLEDSLSTSSTYSLGTLGLSIVLLALIAYLGFVRKA